MTDKAITLEQSKALAAPFGEEAVERTSGAMTGKGYDTTGIKYQFVVNRINAVLGVGRFQTTATFKQQVNTSGKRPRHSAIVDMTLDLGYWSADGQWVTQARAQSTGQHISMTEGDAKKGAFTNALKKAAAMFGVGRQAYEGTIDDDNEPVPLPSKRQPNASDRIAQLRRRGS